MGINTGVCEKEFLRRRAPLGKTSFQSPILGGWSNGEQFCSRIARQRLALRAVIVYRSVSLMYGWYYNCNNLRSKHHKQVVVACFKHVVTCLFQVNC